MPLRTLHVVAYDVCDPRRLRRVLNVVKAYSTGGQKSVHECWLTAAERDVLRAQLLAEIDPREDSVLLIRPEPHAPVHCLGIATQPRDAGFFYVG